MSEPGKVKDKTKPRFLQYTIDMLAISAYFC